MVKEVPDLALLFTDRSADFLHPEICSTLSPFVPKS